MKNTSKNTVTIFILKEDLLNEKKEGEYIKVDLEKSKKVVMHFVETGASLMDIVIAVDKKEVDKCFKRYKSYDLKEREIEVRYKE